MRPARLLALLTLLVALPAAADRLQLRDGTEHQGAYAGGEPGTVRFQVDGGELLSVPVGEVAALHFETPPEPSVRVPSRTTVVVRLTQPIGHGRQAGGLFKGVLEGPLVIDGTVVAAEGTPTLGRISEGSKGTFLKLTDLIIGGHRHRVTAEPLSLTGTLDVQTLLNFRLTSGFEVLESDLGR